MQIFAHSLNAEGLFTGHIEGHIICLSSRNTLEDIMSKYNSNIMLVVSSSLFSLVAFFGLNAYEKISNIIAISTGGTDVFGKLRNEQMERYVSKLFAFFQEIGFPVDWVPGLTGSMIFVLVFFLLLEGGSFALALRSLFRFITCRTGWAIDAIKSLGLFAALMAVSIPADVIVADRGELMEHFVYLSATMMFAVALGAVALLDSLSKG